MKKILILAVILSNPVFAGYATVGKISNLYFMKNGALLFTHSGNRTHLNTDQQCVTSQPTRWAIDGSTDLGRTQISGLLMAYSMGKEITVYGIGGCLDSVHTSRETVNYFYTD
ncbi:MULTISPECIES: hypothetical protein [unclassified Endozoicomonas]|uniref:hypothetical protein n=1 Tax=unclassified Endozoicomonas TaxID=2644528 RepID=UPI003BB77BCC